MIGLDAALAEVLDAGLTLVVPSPQRAAALRLAWTAHQLAAGKASWSSPQILPWRIWLERELQAAAVSSGYHWRTLEPLEETLLWRAAATEAAADHALLHPALLAEGVRRSLALAQEWNIAFSGDSDELQLLRATVAGFRRRATALRAVSASDNAGWPEGFNPDASQVRLAGFPEMGGARRRWLEERGARQLDLNAGVAQPNSSLQAPAVEAYADPEAEFLAAAHWCRGQLQKNPAARLLVVVPQLESRRALLAHCFQTVLQPEAILQGAAVAEPWFAVEGGVALASYAMVRTALELLRLATSTLEFAKLSALLRSPYLMVPPLQERLALDLWLRDNAVLECDAAAIAQLSKRATSREPLVGEALRKLSTILQLLQSSAALPSRHVTARLAELLEAAGWPGVDILSSDELQTRNRFDELLGEVARLGSANQRFSAAAAVEVLVAQAQRQNFAPATADVPVTITADCGDPIVRYDGIRICGLSAAHWPRAAAPDPLLPVLAQRAAGMAAASAAGQLQSALQSMQHWALRSNECVYSHARLEEDVDHRPSPLLAATQAVQLAPATADLAAWLHSQRRGGWYTPGPGAVWQGAARLPRGTQLLELQAACPYRAYAQLRLQAEPLREPMPGIDPRLRGQLLHAALENLWRRIGDHTSLVALDEAGAAASCESAAVAALAKIIPRLPWPPGPALLGRERARIVRLLRMDLEWERPRAGFRVELLENDQATLKLAGHELSLRLDRVDRLEDGRRLIIDYKSGRPETLDADDERPSHPQLPAYAVALGHEVAAVASLHLRPERLQVRGLADSEGRCGLPLAPRPWSEQLEFWRARLAGLVQEFATGRAAVMPLKNACRHCHLDICCRIDAGTELMHRGEDADDGS